jgi:hypothetical protein
MSRPAALFHVTFGVTTSPWDAAVRAEIPRDQLIDWRPRDGWEPICSALGIPMTNATALDERHSRLLGQYGEVLDGVELALVRGAGQVEPGRRRAEGSGAQRPRGQAARDTSSEVKRHR